MLDNTLIKSWLIGLIFFIPLSFLSYVGAEEIDKIVAVVNENALLESDIQRAYKVARLRLATQAAAADHRAQTIARREILENLVLRRIQLDLAEKFKIYVSEEQRELRIRQLLAENNKTQEEYERFLLANGITYAQWRQDVTESLILNELQQRQLRGYIQVTEGEVDDYLLDNLPALLRQARYDLIHFLIPVAQTTQAEIDSLLADLSRISTRQAVIARVSSYEGVRVNDFGVKAFNELPELFAREVPLMSGGDLRAFREGSSWHIIKAMEVIYPRSAYSTEYRLQSISLLQNVLFTNEQLQVRIDAIYVRLQRGENFADLAQTYSARNDLLSNYELDWVGERVLPLRARQEVSALAIGEFSAPFFMDNGWYIVLVENKRRRDVTLDRLKDRVYGSVVNRKLNLSLPFWLNDIRSQAYVEYRLDGSDD